MLVEVIVVQNFQIIAGFYELTSGYLLTRKTFLLTNEKISKVLRIIASLNFPCNTRTLLLCRKGCDVVKIYLQKRINNDWILGTILFFYNYLVLFFSPMRNQCILFYFLLLRSIPETLKYIKQGYIINFFNVLFYYTRYIIKTFY